MELFFHYSPSNENREKFLRAIEQTKAWAKGEPHRFESLHSTLAYLGEVDEDRLPELRELVREVASRHKALEARGGRMYLSHDGSVYGAWGLLYLWDKTPEMQAVYEDVTAELAAHGFWFADHGGKYVPHTTLYMKYYPDEPEKELLPDCPACEDLWDTILISQVTVIDGHVAYYPLFEQRFFG